MNSLRQPTNYRPPSAVLPDWGKERGQPWLLMITPAVGWDWPRPAGKRSCALTLTALAMTAASHRANIGICGVPSNPSPPGLYAEFSLVAMMGYFLVKGGGHMDVPFSR